MSSRRTRHTNDSSNFRHGGCVKKRFSSAPVYSWGPRAFTGFVEFRHGGQKPVTLAGRVPAKKTRPILNHHERSSLVDRLFDQMGEYQYSPFESEGPAITGIRSSLCLKGFDWSRSDHEAHIVVGQVINRLGIERPSHEQGQPEYASGMDYCAWCQGPLDEQERASRKRFCSPDCARMTLTYRARKSEEYAGMVLRAAERMVAKDKAAPRPCLYCGTPYQSEDGNVRFCSITCASRHNKGDLLHKEITCGHCRRPFMPDQRHQRYCSKVCGAQAAKAAAALELSDVVRQCENCREDFTPKIAHQRYCSQKCKKRAIGRAYHARKRGETTDHRITCQSCDGQFLSNIAHARFCSDECRKNAKLQQKRHLSAA